METTTRILYRPAEEAHNYLADLAGQVQTVVTSPPYWGLRTYGDNSAEIGGGDLGDYLAALVNVFTVNRPLYAPSATLWVNLGDTAAGSGGAGGDHNRGGGKSGIPKYRQGKPVLPDGRRIPRKSWCMVPYRFADMMTEAGFCLRSVIVWDKGHARPENLNHARRPGVQTERILLFSLSPSAPYKFHADRLPEGERGDVWRFRPGSDRKTGHVAPFPDELPRRCIEIATDPGDLVFDPFAGSGTTLRVARTLDRHAVGCEIYSAAETTSISND